MIGWGYGCKPGTASLLHIKVTKTVPQSTTTVPPPVYLLMTGIRSFNTESSLRSWAGFLLVWIKPSNPTLINRQNTVYEKEKTQNTNTKICRYSPQWYPQRESRGVPKLEAKTLLNLSTIWWVFRMSPRGFIA